MRGSNARGAGPRSRLGKPVPYHSASPPGGRPDARSKRPPGQSPAAPRSPTTTAEPAVRCPAGNPADSYSRSSPRSSPVLWRPAAPTPRPGPRRTSGGGTQAVYPVRAAPRHRFSGRDGPRTRRHPRCLRAGPGRPGTAARSRHAHAVVPARGTTSPTCSCGVNRTVVPARGTTDRTSCPRSRTQGRAAPAGTAGGNVLPTRADSGAPPPAPSAPCAGPAPEPARGRLVGAPRLRFRR